MYLASVAELMDELGYGSDMIDAQNAIRGALENATSTLEGVLTTSFEREQVTDLFQVSEPGFQSNAFAKTEFRLSHGFISKLDNINMSSVMTEFGRSAPAISGYTLKAEKGVVIDTGTRFRDHFVRIVYTKGFALDEDDPQSYKLSEVPKWLQSIAKIYTKMGLAGNRSLEDSGTRIDLRTLQETARAAITSRIRYAPSAELPI